MHRHLHRIQNLWKIAFLILTFCSISCSTNIEQELFEESKKLFYSENYMAALHPLRKLRVLSPNNARYTTLFVYTKKKARKEYSEFCRSYAKTNNLDSSDPKSFPWVIKVHDRWKWYPKAELEELLVSYKKKELSEAKYLKAKAKLLEEYQYLCHEYDEQIFLNSKYEQNK